jgi:hypothetical protein
MTKKIIAILLAIAGLAIAILTYQPLVTNNNSISEKNFIGIGIVIFLLLLPEIRKAEIGPIKLELRQEQERLSTQIALATTIEN